MTWCNLERPINRDQRLTRRDRVVVEYTRSRVKIKSKLINFKISSQIEGYHGIRENSDDLLKLDQIGQRIDDRN